MKKFIVVLLMLIFSLPVFAEYKPIPKELSKQYKADMEKIIDKNYPDAIKTIDSYFNDVQLKYNKLLKNYDENTYWSMVPEVSIGNSYLYIYAEMMEITQKKYLHTKYMPYGTDSINSISEFIYPYLKDNNVNVTPLIKLSKYAKSKEKIIKTYSDNINKLYFP